jgi:hypothetical protein
VRRELDGYYLDCLLIEQADRVFATRGKKGYRRSKEALERQRKRR